MKRIFIALFLSSTLGFAQTLPDFKKIKMETPADYQFAEGDVISATTYVLTTPFVEKDINRLNSLAFIITWMSGTPDYTFGLDGTITKIMKGNEDLLGIYMACMAKYCLENKDQAKNGSQVELNSVKMLLSYCENPLNNIKMTKQLKKLSEANQKGELEKEL